MNFIDICAGIGGFRLGFERAGHKCIGCVEFNKFARASYEAMYDTAGEWTAWDITKLTSEEIPYADCWTFGFPCQDISIAGKMKGIKNGTRSGIFYDIIKLIKGKNPEDRPRWLVIENVKNLLSIDAGGALQRFCVSWPKLGTMRNGKCLIPKTSESPKTENGCILLDILETNVPEEYYLSPEQTAKLVWKS